MQCLFTDNATITFALGAFRTTPIYYMLLVFESNTLPLETQ